MQQATEMASNGETRHDGEVGLEMSFSSGKGSDAEIRLFKKNYQEGDPKVVNESLTAITSITQQQTLSIRRKVHLMTVLLVIFVLTAAASLALAVVKITGKTPSLNQPTSAPGSGSTRCVERVHFEELKKENSFMKDALNNTRLKLDELSKLVGNMKVNFIQNELLQQKKAIANLNTRLSVVDGVWVNMTATHEAFEKKLDTGFKLLIASTEALNKSDVELTSMISELRQNQNLKKRMSERLTVTVTQLQSGVQELKKASGNVSRRAGSLERGYAQMDSVLKTLRTVNAAQNTSHEDLHSLYKHLNDSLATVNATLNDKLKTLVSNGGKADFSTCQHKNITGTPGWGGNSAYSDASYIEPSNKRATGIACSTDYARDYKLLSPRAGTYICACRGVSPTATILPSNIQCFLHVWECALSKL